MAGDTYTSTINRDLTKGMTIEDNNAQLAFSITPQFKTAPGKEISNRFIYPLNTGNNIQAVYTPMNNGLREDLVVNQYSGNTLSFKYKLNLPSTLQARLMSNGSVGIYSADPVLFSNINIGDSADQARIMAARTKSVKDNLVFMLVAPTVFQSKRSGSSSIADFSLSGNLLTITAKDLKGLSYPLSIDPSVLLPGVGGFTTNGNNEGDITLTSGQITETGLSGGGIGGTSGSGWNNSNNLLSSTAETNGASVAYNGYLYYINGGTSGSQVTYTSITASTGGLAAPTSGCTATGIWCTTAVLPATSTSSLLTAVVYDGYMYVQGNLGGSYNVWYISIASSEALTAPASCASGHTSNGWCATNNGSLPASLQGSAMVTANDYMYIIGGQTGSGPVSTMYYAQLNTDGSTSSWASTGGTGLPNAATQLAAVIYNGYLYVWGGYNVNAYSYNVSNGLALNTVYSAQISSSAGTLPTPASTGVTLPSSAGQADMGYGVANGYLYTIGGLEYNTTGCPSSCSTATTYYNNVYDAQISNGGTLSSWTTTTNLPASTSNSLAINWDAGATAIYNTGTASTTGTETYVYSLGGNSCTTTPACTASSEVQYGAVDTAGWFGTASSSNNLPVNLYYVASAVNNGYLYVLGGTTNGTTASTGVYYTALGANGFMSAPACSGGTITGVWCADPYGLPSSSAVWGAPAVVLTGQYLTNSIDQLYLIQGNHNGTVVKTSQFVGFNSSTGALAAPYNCTGTVTDTVWCVSNATINGNRGTAYEFGSAFADAGNIVYVGGTTNGTTPTSEMDFDNIGNEYNMAGWTPTGALLPTPVALATALISGSNLFVVGGVCTTGPACTSGINNQTQTNVFTGTGMSNTWGTTSGPSTPVFGATGFINNGTIYMVGGCSVGSITSCTTSLNTVQFNYLNPYGGWWSSSTTWSNMGSTTGNEGVLPQTSYDSTAAVYGGFLYELGGINAGSASTASYYFPINNGGTGDLNSQIGSANVWSSGPSLSQAATAIFLVLPQ